MLAALGMTAQRRILLVEDDADVAGAMAAILEEEGYCVVHASDGTEALRALREGPNPCLIVLDVFMPGMCSAWVLPLGVRAGHSWTGRLLPA